MTLNELVISSFGKFQDKRINLEDGLNIIYGKNEAGKSTVHKFIEGMIYGFFKNHTKTKRYTEDYDKYYPWNSNVYRGIMKYNYDNEIFRIERNFDKGNDEVIILDENTGEDITYMYNYNSTIRLPEPHSLHMGINNTIFKNTISIKQLENVTEESLSKEVKDSLINLGGTLNNDISIKNVINRLQGRIDDIGTKNRLKTSPYGRTIEELNKLKEERNKALDIIENTKIYQQEMNELRNDLIELNNKKEKLEEKIYKSRCKELIEKYNKSKNILIDINDLHSKANKLKKYRDIMIEDYGEIIKNENSIETINDSINRIEMTVEDLNNKLSSLNLDEEETINDIKKSEELLKDLKDYKDSINIYKISTVISFLVVLFSFIAGYYINNYIYIISILFVTIIIYFILKIRDINITLTQKKEYVDEVKEEEIKARERTRETEKFFQNQLIEKKTEIERLKSKLKEEKMGIKYILQKNDFEDIDDFKSGIEKKKAYKEIVNKIDYKRDILSNIIGNKTIEELEDDIEECMNIDISDIQDKEELIDKLETVKEEIILKDKRLSNLDEKINTMYSLSRPIQEIDEEISSKKKIKGDYEDNLKSINLAKSTIEKISKNIHKEFAPKLNSIVSNIVSEITNNKYKEVKITEDLQIKVITDEDLAVDIDNLSYGTIDQIYFSLRFGIIDIIKKDLKLPLILDDCFIQYDDSRLSKVMDFLYDESENRQIILFTCQNREKEILASKKYSFNYIEI